MNAVADIRFVLVVCPASLKLNWAREIAKWSVRPMDIEVLGAKGGRVVSDKPGTVVVKIINYDILKKHHADLHDVTWDLLVVDEAHYCKNPKAQRSKEALSIPANRRVFLTGTPIVNRPVELWPLIHALDPETWSSFWSYARRYCGASKDRYGWDFTGATNLEELQKKLRLSVMIRRVKADVLTELPPKRRQVVELDANGMASVVRGEQAAWAGKADAIEAAQAMVAAFDPQENAEAYAEAVKNLNDTVQAAFEELAKLRHDTAVAKAPAVADYVIDALESSEKIVVFAHHHDVMDVLREKFRAAGIGCVELTGKTPLPARQANVDAFQNDPSVRVFLGNIQAAGVGITLTAAAHVVFAELDWVPGNITQAEDRCHRIGQAGSVLVQHLVVDGTLDARMAHILVGKQAVIDAALDNELPASDALDLGWIEQLIAKEQSAEKKRQVARQNAETALTGENILAVQQGLSVLSGACDGARRQDGAGFNKIDAYFGHQLANLPRLTPLQAMAARVMITKYKGQLGPALIDRMYAKETGK